MSSAQRTSLDSLESQLYSPPSLSSPDLNNNDNVFSRRHSLSKSISTGIHQRGRPSISSIGGALDITSSGWSESVWESGQNAISTLLQPPIVRTGNLPHTSVPVSSAHRQPNARDIPPVTLTNIAQVDASVFKPYLTQVGALYDALQRTKEGEDDIIPGLTRRSTRDEEIEGLLDSGPQEPGKKSNISKQASLASLALLSPTFKRRSSGRIGRRAAHAPTPLSTIPNVYFEDDFHLENPRTFDVVSERSDVIRPAQGSSDNSINGTPVRSRKALATNAILQEKLSWYMDTVEMHLISSISAASSSFFAALGSIKELQFEAADSVSRIKRLRGHLETLDKQIAIGGLDIITKRRKLENLRQLGDAMIQLKCVVETVQRCESLVDNGDVDIALDAIDDLENLIKGEPLGDSEILGTEKKLQLRNLSDATALQGVNSDVEILRVSIGKVFETRFLSTLLGDLRSHLETVPFHEILQRWSSASQRSRGGHNREPSIFPTYLAMNHEFRTELLGILSGLHRARYLASATTTYRESVLREIASIVKSPLPSSSDDDNDSTLSASTVGNRKLTQQQRSSILARNLRSLDPGTAEEILLKIYIGVGETLRRLSTQAKVLLDVTSTLEDPSAGEKSPARNQNMSPIDGRMTVSDAKPHSSRQVQEEMHQALDISNLLGQAVDIAQNKIVKILRVRSEQNIHQTPVRFLRYFTINLLFANECEAVSGRGGAALRNVVNPQIKEFIKQLGESEQQKLTAGMDNDQWNPQDFTEYDNEVLSRVLEGSTRDAQAWTVGGKVWLPFDDESPSNGEVSGTTESTTKEKVRPAVIDSESFILPASAMLCLHGLQPFLQVITVIPSLSLEISVSLLSYLQQFNSRCTQLILGAGATRSVGLKNITTKHLALASQALSFIATLIPHTRELVRRHAGSGAVVSSQMGEFDKVRRLYQEHQASISDKLVDIMAGRAAVHVKSMRNIDWEAPSAISVSPYMEVLAKETTTLHKVLSKFLSPSTVHMIMVPVFQSYKDQWGKAFREVVVTENGKQRLFCDAKFINGRIGNIDGAGDFGEYLLKIVGDKALSAPENPDLIRIENSVVKEAENLALKGGKTEVSYPETNQGAVVVNGRDSDKNLSE